MKPLKILFVNRMAGMVRGGGETFDLEIARHLAELGCQVAFLTGRPVIKKAVLGPREWWGRAEGAKADGRRPMANRREAIDDRQSATDSEPSSIAHCSSPIAYRRLPIVHQFLRSPWLGWFPWDKVRGGWRIRLLDLWLFEYRAARWVMRHQDEFDVIQICELPELVKMLKRWGCRAKVSMRLPGPQLYPGYGKGALEKADLLIASGTSIAFYKKRLERELVDVPNGVDVGMFRPANEVASCKLQVASSDAGKEGGRGSEFGVRGRERENHGWTRINTDGGKGEEELQVASCKLEVASSDEAEEGGASSPSGLRRTLNPEPLVLRVIYVARLMKIKNHALLLRAVAGVKAKGGVVSVRLVGSGPLRGDIEGMVRELGLERQVELMGEVPYEQLPGLYQSSDVAVVASDYESFGFVVLEAMACGLPVISTRVGMVPGLLGAELQVATCNLQLATSVSLLPGGLVVPVGDEEALGEAMLWLMTHQVKRGVMGRWNRERVVAEYGWDSSARKLIGEFQRLTS